MEPTFNSLEANLIKMEETLLSLDSNTIKKGLITWDNTTYCFTPRSSIAQGSSYFQSLVNIYNPQATFTNLIQGFEILLEHATSINRNIKNIHHLSDQELIALENRMLRIRNIIDNRSSVCIKFLNENYKEQGKEDKTIKIKELTDSLFNSLKESEVFLSQKLQESNINFKAFYPDWSELSGIKNIAKRTFNDANEAANEILINAKNYKEHLSRIKINLQNGLIISHHLVDDCIQDSQLKKDVDKEALKNVANQKNPSSFSDPISVPESKAIWKSKAIDKFNNEWRTREDCATPTSRRDAEHPENNDLTNFKVQIDPQDGHICITCGVIDTERKAEEFLHGLKEALEDRRKIYPDHPPIHLRIVLHQVNSQWTDANLIPQQHDMKLYIEAQLRQKYDVDRLHQLGLKPFSQKFPVIAHINNSLNLSSYVPLEDSVSNLMNLDGLATQILWLIEDVKDIFTSERPILFDQSNSYWEILQANVDKIQQDLSLIMTRKTRLIELIKDQKNEIFIDDSDANIVSDKPQQKKLTDVGLPKYQKELTDELQQAAAQLMAMELDLKSIKNPTAEQMMMRNKAQVLSLLVGKQTYLKNVPAFSRNQEVELGILLDMMTLSITEINCKSGLDRTGLVRSMWDSLRTMKERFAQEYRNLGETDAAKIEALSCQKTIELILLQDALTLELDSLQSALAPKFERHIAKSLDEVADKEVDYISIRAKLIDTIELKYANDKPKVNALLNALAYQDLICANMLKVAQPITLESTGGAGLKYGHTASSASTGNPHPIQRLPMFITTDTGRVIQLYTVSTVFSTLSAIKSTYSYYFSTPTVESGSHVLTAAGIDLLERLSQKRGD